MAAKSKSRKHIYRSDAKKKARGSFKKDTVRKGEYVYGATVGKLKRGAK